MLLLIQGRGLPVCMIFQGQVPTEQLVRQSLGLAVVRAIIVQWFLEA